MDGDILSSVIGALVVAVPTVVVVLWDRIKAWAAGTETQVDDKIVEAVEQAAEAIAAKNKTE